MALHDLFPVVDDMLVVPDEFMGQGAGENEGGRHENQQAEQRGGCAAGIHQIQITDSRNGDPSKFSHVPHLNAGT